jgi:hypothetical protein
LYLEKGKIMKKRSLAVSVFFFVTAYARLENAQIEQLLTSGAVMYYNEHHAPVRCGNVVEIPVLITVRDVDYVWYPLTLRVKTAAPYLIRDQTLYIEGTFGFLEKRHLCEIKASPRGLNMLEAKLSGRSVSEYDATMKEWLISFCS